VRGESASASAAERLRAARGGRFPNQSWSMDYVADGLIERQELRALTVVDDFTRECLAIEVDTPLRAAASVAVLERLRESAWGLPLVDHGGPGPDSRARCSTRGRTSATSGSPFIRRASLSTIAIESFNGRCAMKWPERHWVHEHASTRARRSEALAHRIQHPSGPPQPLDDQNTRRFRDGARSRRSADRVREKLENPVIFTQDSTFAAVLIGGHVKVLKIPGWRTF